MKVLIACEESQRVCISFRDRGHEAYSCDIQECSGGHPEWHIKTDVKPLLKGFCNFETMNGDKHALSGWDLIIAHPPCTYLSNVSAPHMFPKGELNKDRYKKLLKAREFFFTFLNAPCRKVCVENPMPLSIAQLPSPDCVIQPYEFGEPFTKKTYLWLKGLPPLIPTTFYCGRKTPWVNSSGGKQRKGQKGFANSKKDRSKTFWGIARAMAEQWG